MLNMKSLENDNYVNEMFYFLALDRIFTNIKWGLSALLYVTNY